MELTDADALALRMISLLLAGDGAVNEAGSSLAGVVGWFGAMQAQDLGSAMWSFGVRLPGWTAQDVHDGLERREALRTWPMRGTVHFVPSRDAHWMLELMGGRALAGSAGRRANLGLSDQIAQRAVEVLRAALAGGKRLTRAQCLASLTAAGIDTSSQLGYHLLWYASQLGVTCIAPNVGKEQTFVLLDEWVPDPVRLSRDEALATIAIRYFRSHGPTTRQDFAGWTGLTAADAKRGIALAGDALTAVRVADKDMLVAPRALAAYRDGLTIDGDEAQILSGFDEYLLGFKDRSMMLADEHKAAIIPGGNGVFQPTVVSGGRVIGTWRRLPAKNRCAVAVTPFDTINARQRAAVEHALGSYARFIGQPLQIRWS